MPPLPQSGKRQIMRARTENNAGRDKWISTKLRRPAIQMNHSTREIRVCCKDPISTVILVWRNTCWRFDWSSLQCKTDTQNSRWTMLSSFDSLTKKSIHINHAEKFTEWLTVRTCGIKKESCGNKTFSSQKNDVLSVADDFWRRVKIGLQRLDRPIHKSRSQNQWNLLLCEFVSCFCHKSAGEFIFQQNSSPKHRHGSSSTLIFHKVV